MKPKKNVWRRGLQNGAVVFGSLIFMLALLEIVLRVLAPQPLVASDLFLAAEIAPTAEVQKRSARRWLQPLVHCRHTTSEFDVDVRVNSKGLRDIERPYAKPRGVTRILLIGDSFVFGYGVEEKQRFANLLEDDLKARGLKCEVIAGGVPTWGTEEELLFWREEGRKYQPDFVIECFYDNDVNDNRERALFTLKNGVPVLSPRALASTRPTAQYITGDPINNRLMRVGDDQANHIAPRVEAPHAGFWAQHFHLARLLRVAAYRWRERQVGDTSDVGTALQTRNEQSQRLTARLLETMQRECQSGGAHFALMTIPAKVALQSGGAQARSQTLARFPILLAWQKQQRNLPLCDMLPALRQGGTERQLYYVNDIHFTVRGNQIVGRVLADFVRRDLLHR